MNTDDLARELAPWAWHDPLIYQFLTIRQTSGTADHAALVELVKAMAERHKLIQRQYDELVAHMPPGPFVKVY